MATTVKLRNNYGVGDRVTLRPSAPKIYLEQLKNNPLWDLEIGQKSYSGYRINVMDRQKQKVVTTWDLLTKHLSKGTAKSALIKAIETKQSQLRKVTEEYNQQIEEMQNQISLMDELGTEKIDEADLEYAMRLSKRTNMPIAEAYKAVRSDG